MTIFTNLSLMRLDLRIEHFIQIDVHNGWQNDLYGTTTISSNPYLLSLECLNLASQYSNSYIVLYQKWWLVLKYVFVNCREWPSSKLCFTSRQGYIISLLWPPRLISAQCWARIRVHIFFLAQLKWCPCQHDSNIFNQAFWLWYPNFQPMFLLASTGKAWGLDKRKE